MSTFILLILSLMLLNEINSSNDSSDGMPCDGQVYKKDISNCSWFYRCDISGRSQHLQCLPGLLFNEWINDCDLPYNVPECAEYPFFCRYFALCWTPVIAKTNSSETAKTNSSETAETNSSQLIISS